MDGKPSRDKWSEWVLARSHADDVAQKQRSLRYLGPIRDRLLTNARVREGDAVLDVGAGDGLVAFGAMPLVGPSGRVIFSDGAEWCWGLRDRFERGEIQICPDDELAAQLAGIRYAIDSKGRIQIESKEDMRSRGIASPDIADALMLAFSARQTRPLNIRIPDMSEPSYWRMDSDWRWMGGP